MEQRELKDRLREALRVDVREMTPLAGGCIAGVFAIVCSAGRRLVVKVDLSERIGVEAYMQRELRRLSTLPVPEVVHVERTMLVMEHLHGRAGEINSDELAQRQMGELLAALHNVRGTNSATRATRSLARSFSRIRGAILGPNSSRNIG